MVAFASVADFQTLLGREFADGESERAVLMLDMATGAIRNYTKQHLSLVTDDAVVLTGNTTRQLVLPERPVISVSAVDINGTVIGPVGYQIVRDTLWWGNSRLNVANATDDLGYGWGSISTPINVTYTHGFATIPDDIRACCLHMALRDFLVPIAISAESIGGYSVSYGKIAEGGIEVTSLEQKMLNKYRRTWK